jgi:hypothetical protein
MGSMGCSNGVYTSTNRRFLALLLGVVATFGIVCTPVSAGHAPAVRLEQVNPLTGPGKLVGQVVALTGGADTPTGFTLQIGIQTMDVTVQSARTTFIARSAEADAEGLVKGDYAVVAGRRSPHGWIAKRVDYDIDPFAPLKQFGGTLTRVSPDGRHVWMRQDIGATRIFIVNRQTRFRVDARVVDLPPLLTKGESIQLVAYRTDTGWIALFVDLRSTQFGLR